MFKKILIANRGEIALRILWACRELGIATVAVHSEADNDALHVRYADEDVCIGPPRSSESYLNISSVIAAAEITDADAIHPGYGFLAENAHFAEVCEACKIKFIGPSPAVIRQMGDKAKARELMERAGVPCVPGSRGILSGEGEAVALARKIGFPVIVKASAGGGGRGMRIARSEEELKTAIQTAMNEAKKAFDVADVYLEKYIEDPRHVEFQILSDEHGSAVHLGERECSIQRRHQKLVEESPSMALTPKLRKKMADAALAGARAVRYQNAGTIEFLLAPDGKFYFIEMNTRIQVEHPVTEMVTGIDLVKEQIRIAAGEPLGYGQEEIGFRGHAIECRVNAEDAESFIPSPGRISTFNMTGGPGVRVDSAAHADSVIPPYYDSLVAKVIAHGNTRMESVSRMRRLLDLMVVEGIKTTIPLLRRIMTDRDFLEGRISTHYLERLLAGGRAAAAGS
ncbi:MAG TPA: acetyl-CoA carboxylase biotin carboxylase subunit [Candidatus Polarisedimenticolia bacterium]|nr:acetyl-CoA carboxylase biotin carboxylase subunit [Candidatus Polarisedimenticolia bacterium]